MAKPFALATTPKILGRYLYRVTIDDAGSDNHPVPVDVVKAPLAKLLLVQSTPTFESRHLKDWAAGQGAQMLLMTAISQDRYLTQQVNLPKMTNATITPALLAQFDLLIMDARGLAQLPAGQKSWIEQAVRSGLGLLVLADLNIAEQIGAGLLAGFTVSDSEAQAKTPVYPAWQGHRSELPMQALPLRLGGADVKTLLNARKRQALSVYREVGQGKVALSILQERFRWRLNGQLDTYSNYWQRIMATLARARQDSRFVPESPNTLSQPSFKRQLCVLSEKAGRLQVHGPNGQLSLAQHRLNPYRHCTADWPGAVGWQQYQLVKEETLNTTWRYTFAEQDWPAWQQQRRLDAGQAWLQGNTNWLASSQPTSSRYSPVNPIWYWIILLICCTLLWRERR